MSLSTKPAVIIESIDTNIEPPQPKHSKDQDLFDFDFEEYASRIESNESGGDPHAVSKSGLYIGLYQVGDLALKEVGSSVTVRKFRKNKTIFPVDMQKDVLRKLAEKNYMYLGKYIAMYSGMDIHGYHITVAGLLAASHHVGARKVKLFLKTGKVSTDGNGVKMTVFIKKMEDL